MGTMLRFIALVAASSHLAPYVPRKDIFFGVTVAPGFREGPLARRISRRYGAEILPGGLAGQLGPFLILLAAAAYVAWNWDEQLR